MGKDLGGISYPSDLPACGSFAVGLGEHMEVGGLGTCMEQLELGGKVRNALPDSLPHCGLRRGAVRLRARSRECWLVIKALILTGNLWSRRAAKPCGGSHRPEWGWGSANCAG